MTEIPESALDYLILSKEHAEAIQKFFDKTYVHYDDDILRSAVTRINSFVDRMVAGTDHHLHSQLSLPLSEVESDATQGE